LNVGTVNRRKNEEKVPSPSKAAASTKVIGKIHMEKTDDPRKRSAKINLGPPAEGETSKQHISHKKRKKMKSEQYTSIGSKEPISKTKQKEVSDVKKIKQNEPFHCWRSGGQGGREGETWKRATLYGCGKLADSGISGCGRQGRKTTLSFLGRLKTTMGSGWAAKSFSDLGKYRERR